MPTEKENQALDLIERLRIYFRDQRAQMVSEVEDIFKSIQQTLNTEENRISKLSLTNGKPSVTLEDASTGPVVTGQVDAAVKKELLAGRDEPVDVELKGGNKNAGGN